MTERQRFIRRASRASNHLFCEICRTEAPRFVNGVCDVCALVSRTAVRTGCRERTTEAANPARARTHPQAVRPF
jgi:hypothetical protein